MFSGDKKNVSSLGLAFGSSQLGEVSVHAEVVEETVLETSDSGVVMLASLPDSFDGSVSREQHTAIVVAPVHDDAKNRICFEYSQPLLQSSQRIEPHGGEILGVSLTSSNELRSKRSLEALCNAADSELKNIGHQVASDKKLGHVKDTRCSNQTAYVMNSVVASSSRLVLPAIRLESDNTCISPSEAVLIMQKPIAVSKSLYPAMGSNMPLNSYSVSAGINVSNLSVQCSSPVALQEKFPQIVPVSHSALQSSQRDSTYSVKPSRHSCQFCGRVCAKPSVLQKHVRTHTGERPYPCMTCGLRFKTKSNLYKHCKSRTHSQTHLYQKFSGSESLSADEAVSSSSGKLASTDEPLDNAADNPASTEDVVEMKLKNAQSVSQLQLSPTFAAKKASPDAPTAACKLLAMVDGSGSMYVMEQVALPSWTPAIDQLPQSSFSVTSSATEGVSLRGEKLADYSPNSVRVAVVAASESVFSASFSDSSVGQPTNQSTTTAEALQERISRLISENASIINTPMAEAPRAKRVLRQSSDISASSAAKLNASRPLLRTRSLTPCPTLPVTTQNDANGSASDSGTVTTEDYCHKFIHRSASETAQVSAGKQFLTVPKEPYCIEGMPSGVMLSSNKGEEDNVETAVQCSEVRIVLELADLSTSASSVACAEIDEATEASASAAAVPLISTGVTAASLSAAACTPSTGVTAASLSAVPLISTGVTVASLSAAACTPSLSVHTAERYNRRLLPVPVTSSVPALRVIKPAEQTSMSASGVAVQYVQADAVTPSVPLQCVFLTGTERTVPAGLVARSQNSSPVIVELVHMQPRRGRPKGSKNRPKLAVSSSEPRGAVAARAVSVREPQSASVTSAPTTDSLWRLKLKDQLLRRSLSADRHHASAADKHVSCSTEAHVSQSPNVLTARPCSAETSLAKSALLLSTSSLDTATVATVTSEPAVRSRSCDASVPPKKRRKTLTELGRGTAFGTRVEEFVPAADCQSHTAADDTADDCVFETRAPNASVVGSTSTSGLFPLTNRALQIMYNSPPRASTLCSSAAVHAGDAAALDLVKPQTRFIRLPTGVGLKIPGLVRCSGPASEPESALTVSPACIVDNATASSPCHVNVVGGRDAADGSATDARQVSNDDSASRLSCLASVDSVQKTTDGSLDETELFELPCDLVAGSSGTLLLLLGHCYPSLGIVAEPTFCNVLSTQPACTETGAEADARLSTYGQRHAASCANTADARQTFSLYRTLRLGKDLSYAAAPAVETQSGGVLTHSSYWKYRTDRGESESMAADTGTADVSVSESGQTSASVTVCEDVVSSLMRNAAAEAAPSDWRTTESEQQRVLIFPGGYRSTESYVYVRGRGRGRYVCATCGVRCKKPSVLRKHLRSHTDVRPHHCHVCDVGFKTKGNLSKHLNSKAHHSRSSELRFSSEHMESGKSAEGSSYDADVDSSCEMMAPGGSTVDPESDSGCELQPGSSCEVETEAVSILHQGSGVDTEGEVRPSGEMQVQTDDAVPCGSHVSQNIDVDVMTSAMLSKLTVVLAVCTCSLYCFFTYLHSVTSVDTASSVTVTSAQNSQRFDLALAGMRTAQSSFLWDSNSRV